MTRLQEVTLEIGQRCLRVENLFKKNPLDWTDKELREYIEEEYNLESLRKEQAWISKKNDIQYLEKRLAALRCKDVKLWTNQDWNVYNEFQYALKKLKNGDN